MRTSARVSSEIWQDLRYAFRSLRDNPGFAAAATLSLAIGIGANTAVFSVTNALLLRPLPYRDSDRLAVVGKPSRASIALYLAIKDSHKGFEQLALAAGGNFDLTGDLTGEGEAERAGVLRVSSNLLPMFTVPGPPAAAGRLFDAADDSSQDDVIQGAGGRPLSAVLSYRLWSRRFGGDPCALGRPGTSISVNGQTYRVAGVLPPSFSLPREVLPVLESAAQADIFLPLRLGPAASAIGAGDDYNKYNIVGRLKPGVTFQQAQAELDAITAHLPRDFTRSDAGAGGLTLRIVPLLDHVVGNVRRPLLMLLGAVLFVLLVACANVANLLLARAAARQKEFVMRAALGASRARMVRQLLTESLLLALGGGASAVVVALGCLHWIRALGAGSIPRVLSIGIDARVLGFTLALCLFTGIVLGLATALRISRVNLNADLKAAGRRSSATWGGGAYPALVGGHNLRQMLVVYELALAVVLSTAAGLAIRSLPRMEDGPHDAVSPHAHSARPDPRRALCCATGFAAAENRLSDLAPDLSMHDTPSMQPLVDESLARRRFTAMLLGMFAAMALALAALGTYGVMAYLVTQRTREIGIRIALGATGRGIVGLIVGQSLSLALAGVAGGLACASALSRLGSMLGIPAADTLTVTMAPALLILVALLATWIPARRAARVDPMVSLRSE